MAHTHDPTPGSVRIDFDIEELLDRIGGDLVLFMDVVRIFLEDTPGLITVLETGVAAGNADVVEQTAHAIKGSCAMISAKRIERLADKLEKMGREGNLCGADALCENLLESFHDLKRIMASIVEKMGPSER